MSNSREARQVVFNLFQDLDGFSLDDYKPFSDVSSSLDRIVRFLSAALLERQQKLVRIDEQTYDLIAEDGNRQVRFTLNRNAATAQDELELLGLDHPMIQSELTRWRSLPPEAIGIAVTADLDAPALLSIWIVETTTGNGDRRIVIQPIAITLDGIRVPAIERQGGHYLQATPARPWLLPEQRFEIFSRIVEPTLQRELKHKGTTNGDSSYSAELIAYVEISTGKIHG